MPGAFKCAANFNRRTNLPASEGLVRQFVEEEKNMFVH